MKRKFTTLALVLAAVLSLAGCKKEMNPSDEGNLVPKTVDGDPSLPSIAVNGTVLHAEAFGNPADPLVVFLHGGPGSDYRNAMKVKALADSGYYVIFYDQRGCGLSRRHDKSIYSLQLMMDDLAGVIQHYRTSASQKVFLFGHSWGAILAAAYINSFPTRINGVILSEPGGFTWKNIKAYLERSRKIELLSEATNDALYIDQLFTGKENQHAIIDYKLGTISNYTFASGNIEGIEGPSPYWRYGAAVMQALMDIGEKEGLDVTANLHQFTTKVLFIYSGENKAYGLSAAQKEAAHFPNVQLEKIAGTGHELLWFKWNAVHPIALTYLNSLK